MLTKLSARRVAALVVTVISFGPAGVRGEELWSEHHVARIRNVTEARISPDGTQIAYVLSVPRTPGEDDNGPAWRELHVVNTRGRSRPFITGEESVSDVRWTPDGRAISFLAKRGEDEHKCIYRIAVDGGEARKIVEHGTSITDHSWSPDGSEVAFLAKPEKDEEIRKLEKKGFDAEVYEEDWRPVRVWIAKADDESAEPRALELEGSVSGLAWSPDGAHLAVGLAPTSLIDDRYMNRKLTIVAAATVSVVGRVNNPGKLGRFVWSPDGRHLAVTAALDRHDPGRGSLAVVGRDGGDLRYLMPDYPGHADSIGWRDPETIMYVGHQRCDALFERISIDGETHRTVVDAGGPILRRLSLSADGQAAAFIASTPTHAAEVYYMAHEDDAPRRLTDSNPWFSGMRFAEQEVVTYEAEDGLELDGVLIRPLDEKPRKRYPLILTVHGGPESHRSNGWVTRYSGAGQVGAAEGFAVLYPNYRGSTGRGVAFSKLGQADYGGAEFDDLVDAVRHLVDMGLVDEDRVGITGGSYGGFAAAWGATALTEHFAAAVMFVGISDQISKAGTTDIPQEMYLVHSRRWPWDHWDWFRERSPIYHAAKARTPILILHGAKDKRVDPGQSLQLYRYLKLMGNAPVRLVLYPGEGHGNRKAAARLDYNLRLMRWMNHYLKGPKGDPPPYRIDYGLNGLDGEGFAAEGADVESTGAASGQ